MRRAIRLSTTIAALIATTSCAAAIAHSAAPPNPTHAATTPAPPTPPPPPPTPPPVTSTPPTALALCDQVLVGRDVVSGTWTTVGDLRSWGYSGPVQKRPLRDAFASAAPADPAAWCWTKDAPDSYTAWGVRVGDPARHAITVIGPTTVTPSGPPAIP